MLDLTFLQRHLGGGTLGADDQAVLTALEAAAVEDVENLSGRTFRATASLVEVYDGNDQQTLDLRAPVAAGVTESGVTIELPGGTSWSAVTSSSTLFRIEIHPRLGIRSLLVLWGHRWPAGFRNIRVSYSGGYTAGSEPAEIRTLVADLVALRFRGRLTVTAAEAAAEDTETKLPGTMQAVIEAWRLPIFEPQTRLRSA